ncbi:hypothetical protein EVAR_46511_1 [Eumeta japonica]|uniref:Uncharacterized protein n=1 Tax=Eumeta variegata TaxID=151549 RepID=A0A4C1WVQ8_EUMVA|nr:hypothetical protein EVAR_46511_1 [Eumeta japonica]
MVVEVKAASHAVTSPIVAPYGALSRFLEVTYSIGAPNSCGHRSRWKFHLYFITVVEAISTLIGGCSVREAKRHRAVRAPFSATSSSLYRKSTDIGCTHYGARRSVRPGCLPVERLCDVIRLGHTRRWGRAPTAAQRTSFRVHVPQIEISLGTSLYAVHHSLTIFSSRKYGKCAMYCLRSISSTSSSVRGCGLPHRSTTLYGARARPPLAPWSERCRRDLFKSWFHSFVPQ